MDQKSNTKLIVGIIIAMVVVAGGYFMFSKNQSSDLTNSNEPIKIGFIGPLTGEAASIGQSQKAGIEVAVEEVNNSGGISGRKLEVIFEDGQVDPKAALSAANKLIEVDKVIALIPLSSVETSAIVPVAMNNKIIVLSPSASAPKLSQSGKYFFRTYPSDSFQGKFAAEYIYNKLGKKNVSVLFVNNDWGIGIKDVFVSRFKELGGNIVSEDGVMQTNRDVRTTLQKIKNAKAEMIYSPLYPEVGTVEVRQMNELGINLPVFGGDAWDDTKFFKDISGAKNSVMYSAVIQPISNDLKTKILAISKLDQVLIGTVNAYDNIKILADVIKKVGTDADKMQEELHKLKDYQGVSGVISFDQNGDLTTANYVVKSVSNGSAAEVK